MSNGMMGVLTVVLVVFVILFVAQGRPLFRSTGGDIKAAAQDVGHDIKAVGRDAADSIRRTVQ